MFSNDERGKAQKAKYEKQGGTSIAICIALLALIIWQSALIPVYVLILAPIFLIGAIFLWIRRLSKINKK